MKIKLKGPVLPLINYQKEKMNKYGNFGGYNVKKVDQKILES